MKTRREEMFALVEQQKSSGQNQSLFCREQGISYYTFRYWFEKYHLPECTGNETFTVIEPEPPIARNCDLKITYPNGVNIELSGDPSPAFVGSLINLV